MTEPMFPALAVQGTGNDGSNVTFDGEGFARAQQTALGFSNAEANGIFFSGSGGQDRLSATTVFEEMITNPASAPRDYEFDLFLKNMFVDIYDFAGAPASPNPFDDPTTSTPGGRISYRVEVNGAVIYDFVAEVFGGNGAVSVDQAGGTDGMTPDGMVVSSVRTPTVRSEMGSDGGFGFDDLFATLDAGTFGPGESITLVATMTAEVVGFPFELGARAVIGDPNDLSGTGVSGLRTTMTGVVPLPAAVWLLLGGLGALGLVARRAA